MTSEQLQSRRPADGHRSEHASSPPEAAAAASSHVLLVLEPRKLPPDWPIQLLLDLTKALNVPQGRIKVRQRDSIKQKAVVIVTVYEDVRCSWLLAFAWLTHVVENISKFEQRSAGDVKTDVFLGVLTVCRRMNYCH